MFVFSINLLYATSYNTDLVQWGTAENDTDMGHWTKTLGGNFVRANYTTGWAGASPVVGSNFFFYANGGTDTTVEQIMDISDLAINIDS